jgi:hypothetical protein
MNLPTTFSMKAPEDTLTAGTGWGGQTRRGWW